MDQEFRRIVQIMFQGGQGKLILTDEKDVLQGGVEIFLQLPGKRQQPLTLLSGGERALAVIALLIAFLACGRLHFVSWMKLMQRWMMPM